MVEDHTKMGRGALGTFSASRVRLARGERRVLIIKTSAYSAQDSASASGAGSTNAMFARTFARIHGGAPPMDLQILGAGDGCVCDERHVEWRRSRVPHDWCRCISQISGER